MFNTVHIYFTAHQLLGTLLKLTFYFFISGCGPISAVGLEYRYFGPQGTSLADRSFVYLLAIAECLNGKVFVLLSANHVGETCNWLLASVNYSTLI
jgi:hypothetical protein